ncbi:hypothetical protein ACJRO7_020277 [Eucalyptus globulus]|uniref:Uncharacterized protein n=1 Tax=Eucalyptus globulus TaxID=34317 RepID=A0ABD3KG17_EUCGL
MLRSVKGVNPGVGLKLFRNTMAKSRSHCGADGSAAGLEGEGLGHKEAQFAHNGTAFWYDGNGGARKLGKELLLDAGKRVRMFDVRRHRKLEMRDRGSWKRLANLHHYLTTKSGWNYGMKPWSCRMSGDICQLMFRYEEMNASAT